MNYLAGPLTRNQIPDLNQLAGATEPVASSAGTPPQAAAAVGILAAVPAPTQPAVPAAQTAGYAGPTASGYSATRPAILGAIDEYFLPNNLTFTQAFKVAGREMTPAALSQGLIYRAVILGQASARLVNLRFKLDIDISKTALVANPDRRGVVRWDNYPSGRIDQSIFDKTPDPQARFASLDAPLNDAKMMNTLQKDYLEWAYRTAQVTVRANDSLDVYAGPDTTEGDFHAKCSRAAQQACDAEIKKASTTYDTKLRALQDKLEREQSELKKDQAELSSRKMEVAGTVAETVAGFLGIGRKHSISSSISKQRMASQAKSDVQESVDVIKDVQAEITAIEQEKADALKAINDKWVDTTSQITEIPISAQKKDILLDFFGVAWMPYHLVKVNDQTFELPGFSAGS
jgi:hypothetical protein